MRKAKYIIAIIAIFLQACATLELLPAPAPNSTSAPSPTVTETATITLTPTRTITPTPRNTATPLIFATYTPVVLVSPGAPTFAAAPFIDVPNAPVGGFEKATTSESKIYWGVCKQGFTRLVVQVEHPDEVYRVYLFFRLESAKKPGDTTPWSGTVTDNKGTGFFVYKLDADNVPERKNYLKAWVQYQFVAVDTEQKVVGRSVIYTRSLTIEPCK